MTISGLSCSMWDLVPQTGMKPRPPALAAQCLGYWTTRETLMFLFLSFLLALGLPSVLLLKQSICLMSPTHIHGYHAAAAKSRQSCPTLCDPRDSSPPDSPIPGTLQARTLEWVAISLSDAWKWKMKVKSRSHDRLFATPWTAAYQVLPSMGFSRQEYWSGVPLPSPMVIILEA